MILTVLVLAAVSTLAAWLLVDTKETWFYKVSASLSLFVINCIALALLIELIG